MTARLLELEKLDTVYLRSIGKIC